MSIRKREWTTAKGEKRQAWYYDYRDQNGKRRAKQFRTKGEAVAYETQARGEIKTGVHVADSTSKTLQEAGELWLGNAEANGREASTLRQYRQHLKYHIAPLIGSTKLSRLTTPVVEEFRDRLVEKCSRPLARAVLTSLKGILKNAKRIGLVSYNAAGDTAIEISKRHRKKVVMPTKDEIRAMLQKSGELWPITRIEITRKRTQKVVAVSWRPLLVTAIFSGLRCSELRGLSWDNVDFDEKVIRVRQRADFLNKMGVPKSEAGNREVPMSPMVINTLKEWKLACPTTPLKLVFPHETGGIHSNSNLHAHYWGPLQRVLGIISGTVTVKDKAGKPKLDKEGRPIMRSKPKYTFHALRHFAASLFIEQKMSPKKVQEIMGHSSIQVTYDIYGHLFASPEDDAKAMAQIEARLLG